MNPLDIDTYQLHAKVPTFKLPKDCEIQPRPSDNLSPVRFMIARYLNKERSMYHTVDVKLVLRGVVAPSWEVFPFRQDSEEYGHISISKSCFMEETDKLIDLVEESFHHQQEYIGW